MPGEDGGAAPPPELAAVLAALRRIRVVRVGLLEGALVDLMAAELDRAGISYRR